MSYDDKVKALASAIAPCISFKDVEEARNFVASYRLPRTEDIPLQIERMAERLFESMKKLDLTNLLTSIGNCKNTRLSALREAIRICATDYVARMELLQDHHAVTTTGGAR